MSILSDMAKSFFATSIVLVTLGLATSANAAWVSGLSTGSSGTYAMASFGHNFTPVSGGGTGGQTFVSPTAYLATGKSYYFTVANTGSVPAVLSGTVGANFNGAGAPAVVVNTCAATWTGSNCPTATQIYSGYPNTPQSLTYGTVPVGGLVRVQVQTGALLDNISVFATASEASARSGLDRTAG